MTWDPTEEVTGQTARRTVGETSETASYLAPFLAARRLDSTGVHVAEVISRACPGTGQPVLLAAALCVRALQLGHVCVVLEQAASLGAAEADGSSELLGDGGPSICDAGSASVAGVTAMTSGDLDWPTTAAWAEALRSSNAVEVVDPLSRGRLDPSTSGPTTEARRLRPLVFDGTRVYLERYWRYERFVGDALLERAGTAREDHSLAAILDDLFGLDSHEQPDLQKRAARVALTRRVSVVAGGPGTGKTFTVARVLIAAHSLALGRGKRIGVALAAPTGKAAARMTEAIHASVADETVPGELKELILGTEAQTVHRLLGYDDGVRYRHDQYNKLPHDMVVVDETSMVALPLMARLLSAVRDDSSVVFVGDPYQLASIEAGAVLGDVVGPMARGGSAYRGGLADSIVVLDRLHRFGSDSAIAGLADAVRTGDADRAIGILGSASGDELTWISPGSSKAIAETRSLVTSDAARAVEAARSGDGEEAVRLSAQTKVLCATRFGDFGSFRWTRLIESHLARMVDGFASSERWYVGRPVIITRNDYVTNVFNGDTGLVVNDEARRAVIMEGPTGVRRLSTSQLDSVETWWAMTIHKSQGSEFTHAVVSLPERVSPVLTRELLYTAVTRGKERVSLIASEEILRYCINRPVDRASGLQTRLWDMGES